MFKDIDGGHNIVQPHRSLELFHLGPHYFNTTLLGLYGGGG